MLLRGGQGTEWPRDEQQLEATAAPEPPLSHSWATPGLPVEAGTLPISRVGAGAAAKKQSHGRKRRDSGEKPWLHLPQLQPPATQSQAVEAGRADRPRRGAGDKSAVVRVGCLLLQILSPFTQISPECVLGKAKSKTTLPSVLTTWGPSGWHPCCSLSQVCMPSQVGFWVDQRGRLWQWRTSLGPIVHD